MPVTDGLPVPAWLFCIMSHKSWKEKTAADVWAEPRHLPEKEFPKHMNEELCLSAIRGIENFIQYDPHQILAAGKERFFPASGTLAA